MRGKKRGMALDDSQENGDVTVVGKRARQTIMAPWTSWDMKKCNPWNEFCDKKWYMIATRAQLTKK